MKDKELDAVRLALRRIQRIASEPMDENDAPGGEPVAAGRGGLASRYPGLARKVPLQLAAMIFAGAVVAAGVAVFTSLGLFGPVAQAPDRQVAAREDTGSTIAPQPALEPQARGAQPAPVARVAANLEMEAQRLLEAGRVREARQSLANGAQRSPELALILARSYDPNYLRLIPNVDAAADVAEAERWYRTWRDIASEQGLVMEPERFDRIIKAMR